MVMAPCPACGEASTVIRTGSNHSYIVVHPSQQVDWEWFAGRLWIERSCAACGTVLETAHEELDAPEETTPRAVR